MKPIVNFFQTLSEDDIAGIREAVLEVLSNPGMRIESELMREVLKAKGVSVDDASQMASFPREIVEETLEKAIAEEKQRRQTCNDVLDAEKSLSFSWHSAFIRRSPELYSALGGGCPLYYEYKDNSAHYGTENDLIRLLNIAEGIEEIKRCGNAVHCIIDKDGNEVPAGIMPIITASVVAKNSSKPGVTALMSVRQLDYLIEMGTVVKGSLNKYMLQPIFINVNDTVPPLGMSKPEGDIMHALASKGLPVYILPMPLMGVAGPVSVFSCVVLGIAEVLGTWVCAKAVNFDTPVECTMVSGVLEPRTGNPCFSAPEVAAIDISAAQFFRHFGLKCGTGVGLIDATAPGVAAAYERSFKGTASALCGESSYPVGILAGGNIFSPEQMMIDLDLAASQNRFLHQFDSGDIANAVSLIRERGAGGCFMDTEHTGANFRERIWIPRVFERCKGNDPKGMVDPVRKAYEKWNEILQNTEPYHLPDDQAKEIDKIVARAEKDLLEGSVSTSLCH